MNILYTIVLLRKRQGLAVRKDFITKKDGVLQAPGGYLHTRLDTSVPDLQSV